MMVSCEVLFYVGRWWELVVVVDVEELGYTGLYGIRCYSELGGCRVAMRLLFWCQCFQILLVRVLFGALNLILLMLV